MVLVRKTQEEWLMSLRAVYKSHLAQEYQNDPKAEGKQSRAAATTVELTRDYLMMHVGHLPEELVEACPEFLKEVEEGTIDYV